MIKNHINLHHSQTDVQLQAQTELIKNHINLHHSQTYKAVSKVFRGLRTILIYIILKHSLKSFICYLRLRTILIYIILKQRWPSIRLSTD